MPRRTVSKRACLYPFGYLSTSSRFSFHHSFSRGPLKCVHFFSFLKPGSRGRHWHVRCSLNGHGSNGLGESTMPILFILVILGVFVVWEIFHPRPW
jgi:hypothetical protein